MYNYIRVSPFTGLECWSVAVVTTGQNYYPVSMRTRSFHISVGTKIATLGNLGILATRKLVYSVRVCKKPPLVLFKSFGIAHEHHEQHLLLYHCCHSHINLFKT